MKIKQIKSIHTNKLIELQILKSKVYRKNINPELKQNERRETQLYLKKIINIIYEFHVTDKRILFLNFPKEIEKKLNKDLKQNQHIFIPNESLLNGIISNQKVNFSKSTELQKFIKNNLKVKIPMKKLIDLIVIFNPASTINSDKTLYLSQIPTITINDDLNFKLNLKQNYKLIGDFKFVEKQMNNNILFSILKSVLKNNKFKKKNTLYRHNIKNIIKNDKT